MKHKKQYPVLHAITENSQINSEINIKLNSGLTKITKHMTNSQVGGMTEGLIFGITNGFALNGTCKLNHTPIPITLKARHHA